MNSGHLKASVSEWTSPRDLAIQPPPTRVALADGSMEFFSVVPSFGADGNFIALLTTDTDLHVLQNHTLFCSGPGRAQKPRILDLRTFAMSSSLAHRLGGESVFICLKCKPFHRGLKSLDSEHLGHCAHQADTSRFVCSRLRNHGIVFFRRSAFSQIGFGRNLSRT